MLAALDATAADAALGRAVISVVRLRAHLAALPDPALSDFASSQVCHSALKPHAAMHASEAAHRRLEIEWDHRNVMYVTACLLPPFSSLLILESNKDARTAAAHHRLNFPWQEGPVRRGSGGGSITNRAANSIGHLDAMQADEEGRDQLSAAITRLAAVGPAVSWRSHQRTAVQGPRLGRG